MGPPPATAELGDGPTAHAPARPSLARIMWSYVSRDWRHEVSYRLNFAAFLAYPVIWVSVFAILGQVVEGAGVGGFATFIVLGVVMWRFVHVGFYEGAITMRWEQWIGTFKHVFMTPRHPLVPVAAQTVSGLSLSLVNLAIMVATAEFLFGVRLGITPLGVLFILIGWASILGFGLAITGLAMLHKQVDVIYRTVFFSFQLFSGVFFDWRILPEPLQYVSMALPITHALDGLRMSSAGTPVPPGLFWLILVTGLGALAVGALVLHLAQHAARKRGVLEEY